MELLFQYQRVLSCIICCCSQLEEGGFQLAKQWTEVIVAISWCLDGLIVAREALR